MKYQEALNKITDWFSSYKDANGITVHERHITKEYKEAKETLYKLIDKIENGTLIELPCKVGDKVFSVWCGVGQDFTIKADVVWNFTVRDTVYVTTDYIEEGLFGANVFLTKEEAEAKLKELKSK